MHRSPGQSGPSLSTSRRDAPSGRSHGGRKKKPVPLTVTIRLIGIIFSLIVLGTLFVALIAPEELEAEINSHSYHTFNVEFGQAKKLSMKILDWLPQQHKKEVMEGIETTEPDWEQKFWTPIDVEVSGQASTTMVTLCHLNFREYYQNPHLYPMFKDLTGLSHCNGNNRKRDTLANLLAELEKDASNVIKPNGFVFHESRVGSTLVANTLASDPFSMVFSESTPPANALLHCHRCSHEQQVTLFRDVVTLMGHSPIHKNLFFKFQSITSTKMQIALEAFPDTPFAFVYRDSVQTMMSHLDPRKSSSGAPCLRSKRSPPQEVTTTMSNVGLKNLAAAPREAWCAAHLSMLCESAIAAYSKHGVTTTDEGHVKQRGIMINYESLPGIIPRVVLPLFGAEPSTRWLKKMHVESRQYSKGRTTGSRIFKGDNEDKEKHATEAIEKYSSSILDQSYSKLLKLGEESLRAARPAEFQAMVLTEEEKDSPLHKRNWKFLAEIPSHTEEQRITGDLHGGSDGSISSLRGGGDARGRGVAEKHSKALEEKDFVPWAPFANTHESKSFHPASCPEHPLEGYPAAYHMSEIVENWNPDNTEIPPFHYDTLCHFDRQNETEYNYAMNYRRAEVPFVVYNIPEVDEVVKKWNNLDYLQRKLGYNKYRTELSTSNHFMYWNSAGSKKKTYKDWKPPTGISQTTFEKWMEIAVKGQNVSQENRIHQYFRVSSDMGSPWLYDELPFFKPKESLFIVNPREQRGIHCRFGMRSIIAEAHFDGSRNSVVEIGGMRRWILAHPKECPNMHMLPRGHPSGRHSEIDWSKPDNEKFPNFKKIQGNEVILQPGDFLYVPTYWIHYIVSLNINFQCNTRSGRTSHYDMDIHRCGF